MVSRDENTIISFIPSIHRNKNDSYAMLQCVLASLDTDGNWTVETDYISYDRSQFIAENEPFKLSIGENIFWEDKIKINFYGSQFNIKGEVRHHNLRKLPSTFFSPDIMGPFSYLPGLTCIHSIISLDHELEGDLEINQVPTSFSNGRGYIEKDLFFYFFRGPIFLLFHFILMDSYAIYGPEIRI